MFKKGDKIKLRDGRVGAIESGPFPMGSQEMYHIRLDDGRLTDAAERNITSANSTSMNPVVQNALAARNADESLKVKVVADIETLFGKEHKESTMTIGQLKAAFAKIGHARLFADVERNFDAGKGGDVNVAFPCEVYFTMA